MPQGLLRRRVTDREKNLVGFVLGNARYAVEIRRVREIVRPLPLIPLPQAPPAILGVADHRGEVLPVLDVRRRLGMPPADKTTERNPRTKWLLVSLASRGVALVVDAVTEVFAAAEQDRRDVPSTGVGDAARGISSVFAYRDSLVFVLDVDRIAAAAELMELPGDVPMFEPLAQLSGDGLPRGPRNTPMRGRP